MGACTLDMTCQMSNMAMFNPLYATYLILRIAFWRFVLFCACRRHPSRLHAQWMLFLLRDALRREFRERLD